MAGCSEGQRLCIIVLYMTCHCLLAVRVCGCLVALCVVCGDGERGDYRGQGQHLGLVLAQCRMAWGGEWERQIS